MNRSKSFLLGSSSAGDGKMRKMLKKSASILYPSWLATNKKPIVRQQNKKQSVDEDGKVIKVPLPEEEEEEEAEAEEYGEKRRLRQQQQQEEEDGGWEPVQSVGKSTADAATSAGKARPDAVQLPRLGGHNRLIQNLTTVDHPIPPPPVKGSTSKSKKWHVSSAASTSSVASSTTSKIQRRIARGSNKETTATVERRWQSLIALTEDDVDIHGHSMHPNHASSIYSRHHYPNTTSGSVYSHMSGHTAATMTTGSAYQSSDDLLSESNQYQRLLMMVSKSHSQSSLSVRDHSNQMLPVSAMTSCPSYESLDDYLLTSEDDDRQSSRRNQFSNKNHQPQLTHGSNSKKQQGNGDYKQPQQQQQQQRMIYADSFESLPRPPPPADADYSPPDISPDDSSETRGRVRNKLQRLPTFIERQEAWQRKTWNQYGSSISSRRKSSAISSSTTTAGSVVSIAEASPELADWHGANLLSAAGLSDAQILQNEQAEQLRRYWRSRSEEDATLSRSTTGAGLSPLPQYLNGATRHNTNNVKGGGSNPAIFWHDWMPPPDSLINCGCGLCRISVSMNQGPLSSKSNAQTQRKPPTRDLPVHPPPLPPVPSQPYNKVRMITDVHC